MRAKLVGAAFAAAIALWCSILPADAVTFNVIGANPSGDTVSGTLEADAALTNVTAIDLFVSGPGLVPDGPLGSGFSYVSPLLLTGTAGIFLSFAGGPTPADITQLILITFDPTICGTDLVCQAFIAAQQSVAFSAVATAAAVPLPAALPLFATGLGALGLFGWRRKRKAEALAS